MTIFETGVTYEMRYIGDSDLVTYWSCDKRTNKFATFTNTKTGESVRRKIKIDTSESYEYVDYDTYSMAPVIRANKKATEQPAEIVDDAGFDVSNYELRIHSKQINDTQCIYDVNEDELFCEIFDRKVGKRRGRAILDTLTDTVSIYSLTCYDDEDNNLGELGDFLERKINTRSVDRYMIREVVTKECVMIPINK